MTVDQNDRKCLNCNHWKPKEGSVWGACDWITEGLSNCDSAKIVVTARDSGFTEGILETLSTFSCDAFKVRSMEPDQEYSMGMLKPLDVVQVLVGAECPPYGYDLVLRAVERSIMLISLNGFKIVEITVNEDRTEATYKSFSGGVDQVGEVPRIVYKHTIPVEDITLPEGPDGPHLNTRAVFDNSTPKPPPPLIEEGNTT